MPFPWVAASILGSGALGYLGGEADRRAAGSENALSREQAWDINQRQLALREQEIAMQKEFAQNGIRWRVEDAEKAGLHPLAALGASTTGYSPVMPAFVAPNSQPVPAGSKYRALADMGQNITRAMMATATAAERESMALDLSRKKLENRLIEEQVKGAMWENQKHAMGPPIPSMSQYFVTPSGTIMQMPSEGASQAAMGSWMQQFENLLLNKFIPQTKIKGKYFIPGTGQYVDELNWQPNTKGWRTLQVEQGREFKH